ncbi:universal stress protein [Streptomyces sp. NPDC101158]|uniref:universal stress protein n=1 Tax=Streptomyces sp. NPDC101158 TaxID=3366117 RepID=UPI0037F788D0
MTPQVTVGVDGSEESLAAARWAAREAVLREVPLRLLHVSAWPDAPEVPAGHAGAIAERDEALLREVAERAEKDHRGLEVRAERVRGRAAETLTAAANEADLLVLGSRGLGALAGFVAGSVSLAVVGAARQPVVLVRAKAPGALGSDGIVGSGGSGGSAGSDRSDRSGGSGGNVGSGGIVMGVDIYHPCEPLLGFAFTEAARRGLPLRLLHSWTLPASYGYASLVDPGAGEELGDRLVGGLDDLMEPWRKRYPEVGATAETVVGSAAYRMVEASRDAELVLVGRRRPHLPLGPHLGHVAHAVVHHSPAPVAVIPLG